MGFEAVRGHEPDGCKTKRDPEGPCPHGPEPANAPPARDVIRASI
jgi:hypothetical protein